MGQDRAQAAASDDAASPQRKGADDTKRQGEKLRVAADAAGAGQVARGAGGGDSPKRQGDKLEGAVREAAKG